MQVEKVFIQFSANDLKVLPFVRISFEKQLAMTSDLMFEHFSSAIKENDIKRAAAGGLDGCNKGWEGEVVCRCPLHQ